MSVNLRCRSFEKRGRKNTLLSYAVFIEYLLSEKKIVFVDQDNNWKEEYSIGRDEEEYDRDRGRIRRDEI